MAISIGGTVVIDDSRNIVNVNDIRVGLVTITGSTGNIQTPGTITGGGFGVAGTGFSVSPGIGSTNINPVTTASIILSFPTSVTRGTGTVTLRTVSAGGTAFKTYNAATAPEITVLNNTWSLNTTPVGYSTQASPPVLPFAQTLFLVVPSTAIAGFVGLNTTGASSYSFTTSGAVLGAAFEGGFLICRAAGIQWIVSPYSAEVGRTWYLRTDSNTRAQQVSGCTGWFVPTCGQLQNPGYLCRTFWDSFSLSRHFSTTEFNSGFAWMIEFNGGGGAFCANGVKNYTLCIRSFRCVTY